MKGDEMRWNFYYNSSFRNMVLQNFKANLIATLGKHWSEDKRSISRAIWYKKRVICELSGSDLDGK